MRELRNDDAGEFIERFVISLFSRSACMRWIRIIWISFDWPVPKKNAFPLKKCPKNAFCAIGARVKVDWFDCQLRRHQSTDVRLIPPPPQPSALCCFQWTAKLIVFDWRGAIIWKSYQRRWTACPLCRWSHRLHSFARLAQNWAAVSRNSHEHPSSRKRH